MEKIFYYGELEFVLIIQEDFFIICVRTPFINIYVMFCYAHTKPKNGSGLHKIPWNAAVMTSESFFCLSLQMWLQQANCTVYDEWHCLCNFAGRTKEINWPENCIYVHFYVTVHTEKNWKSGKWKNSPMETFGDKFERAESFLGNFWEKKWNISRRNLASHFSRKSQTLNIITYAAIYHTIFLETYTRYI